MKPTEDEIQKAFRAWKGTWEEAKASRQPTEPEGALEQYRKGWVDALNWVLTGEPSYQQ